MDVQYMDIQCIEYQVQQCLQYHNPATEALPLLPNSLNPLAVNMIKTIYT